MSERNKAIVTVGRILVGSMICATGLALILDGNESWGLFIGLIGLVVSIAGAFSILIKVLLTALYVGVFIAVYSFADRTDISFFFESGGPDWWAHFWWIPALVAISIGLLAVVVYRELGRAGNDT